MSCAVCSSRSTADLASRSDASEGLGLGLFLANEVAPSARRTDRCLERSDQGHDVPGDVAALLGDRVASIGEPRIAGTSLIS